MKEIYQRYQKIAIETLDFKDLFNDSHVFLGIFNGALQPKNVCVLYARLPYKKTVLEKKHGLS
jgi:hypothetical protein